MLRSNSSASWFLYTQERAVSLRRPLVRSSPPPASIEKKALNLGGKGLAPSVVRRRRCSLCQFGALLRLRVTTFLGRLEAVTFAVDFEDVHAVGEPI